MSSEPAVSIIVAAYNRGNVLRYAIESVLANSYADWEMIVVGDHCTDDTRDVVEGFEDARIRFFNLPENTGGQSAPNNKGVELARGRYLCFLNQDDLYFPDHLAASIAHLEETKADFIWSPVVAACPENREKEALSLMDFFLDGVTAHGRFDPSAFIVASSWFMRRAVVDRVGPWVAGSETYLSPSREWLFRAWRKGINLRYHPHVSVICAHSGNRKSSYESREYRENERYQRWLLGNPDFPALVLERAAMRSSAALREAEQPGVSLAVQRLAGALFRWICAKLDVHPVAIRNFLKFGRRGGFLEYHKALVFGQHGPESEELLHVVRRGDVLRVGEPAARSFLKRGWHDGEITHCWTSSAVATISVGCAPEAMPSAFWIRGAPLFVPQDVEFHINGTMMVRHRFDSRDSTDVCVPVNAAVSRIELSIRLERVVSPKDVDLSADVRPLGFHVQQVLLA